ncbi:aminotransferase class I/II-fold pyridoxal phosphate-dependent enzyme [Clostridium sp.]|uniref:aminotransferase class I/II-fold pyridoxal phosphate-dependent enzyme n=1 Tax=Clostridium sp. TaxID=1506 RepID=UPI003F3D0019
MKDKLPLLTALTDYHKENNLILSMPGNKCGLAFTRDNIGEEFKKKLGSLDITEVDPLDNLHAPEGVIKEAQELLAKLYGVKKAYFMVNGSSGGNLASIFAAFNEGDEVLVERNCHKSIYNGLILRKLKVIYIDAKVDEKRGIHLPPNREKIFEALNKAENPKGIILTQPNYYGISYNIEDVVKELKSKGMKIIIDGAHGAHFGFSNKLPNSFAKLGDYIVLSAHKTLPALTQGGYLLVNDENTNVEFYIKAFMTTSPSYLIMASLDYSRYYLSKYAKDDYEKLINIAEDWKNKINNLNKVNILEKNDINNGYGIDLSRYLMLLPQGYSGHKLLDYLRKNKIQCEMSFNLGVVLIFSPFNNEEDFKKIYDSINKLSLEEIKEEASGTSYYLTPEKVLEPYEVFNKDFKLVSLDDSIGEIARESIIPYPPGIPLICAGEKITKDAINIIKEYLRNGRSVIGIEDEMISIVEK